MVSPRALGAALVEGLLSLASPPRCAACDERVAARVVFCPACARTVERAPAGASAPFLYGGALARAIHRFKYEDATHLARPLGELLRHAPVPVVGLSVVVPVPLHPRRLAQRGFNQAALLGDAIARAWSLPMNVTALSRVRDTSRQAALERDARLTNVDGAFHPAHSMVGHPVLLVDDVATTGATLRACAASLTAAGAKVRNLVLAVAL